MTLGEIIERGAYPVQLNGYIKYRHRGFSNVRGSEVPWYSGVTARLSR